MTLLGDALKRVAGSKPETVLGKLTSNTFKGVLLGALVTAVIQSSSATTIMVVGFVNSGIMQLVNAIGIIMGANIETTATGWLLVLAGTGVVGYDVAIPMVVGMCIGACMPVLLSAIGTNLNGKRADFVYLYFNLSGAVILMGAFYLINAFLHFDIMDQTATSMGTAIVNTVFKIAATIILAPMARLIEKLAVITIKDKSNDDEEYREDLLEERFLKYPPLALEQWGTVMDQMIHAAFKNCQKGTELLSKFNQEKYDKIMSREDRVDKFEDALGAYLVRLNTLALSEKETRTIAKYLSLITNVERISDHAVNLAELSKELEEKNIRFSDEATKQLELLMDATREILDITAKAARENDIETAKTVEPLEDVIDVLTRRAKAQHIQRLQEGNCTLELGFVFNECLGNFERVADHCSNIAVSVLEFADAHVHAHSYLHTVKENADNSYHDLYVGCANKFNLEPE